MTIEFTIDLEVILDNWWMWAPILWIVCAGLTCRVLMYCTGKSYLSFEDCLMYIVGSLLFWPVLLLILSVMVSRIYWPFYILFVPRKYREC